MRKEGTGMAERAHMEKSMTRRDAVKAMAVGAVGVVAMAMAPEMAVPQVAEAYAIAKVSAIKSAGNSQTYDKKKKQMSVCMWAKRKSAKYTYMDYEIKQTSGKGNVHYKGSMSTVSGTNGNHFAVTKYLKKGTYKVRYRGWRRSHGQTTFTYWSGWHKVTVKK